jgi:hypothetical protein
MLSTQGGVIIGIQVRQISRILQELNKIFSQKAGAEGMNRWLESAHRLIEKQDALKILDNIRPLWLKPIMENSGEIPQISCNLRVYI